MESASLRSGVIRRKQSERSAQTRTKIIDAAISCLHKVGFGVTTTTMVAQTAGVSRGAMLHHFPLKTDLMLAVVRRTFERTKEHYRSTSRIAQDSRWMHSRATTIWEIVSGPSGVAVMEIMLASRSNSELADELRTLQKQVDVQAYEWTAERYQRTDGEHLGENDAVYRLVVATARGLAMKELVMLNHVETKQSLDVLNHVLRHFYPAED